MISSRGRWMTAFLGIAVGLAGATPRAEAQRLGSWGWPRAKADPAVRRAQAPAATGPGGAPSGSDNDLSQPRANRPGGGGAPPDVEIPGNGPGSGVSTGNGPGAQPENAPETAGPGSGVGAGNAGADNDLSLPRAERPGGGGEPTDAAAAADAAKEDDTKLLMKLLNVPDEFPFRVYGWIQNSYTGNTNGRPASGINFGVNPNNLANRWMGNQYYLIAERVLKQDDTFNFGFRFDNLFGNDAQFNHSNGVFDRTYKLNSFRQYDPAQYYVEAHLPIVTEGGIDIKVGRFYTLAGYEVVPATGRPLLSVPYMFNYGQPFTHHGVLTTWHYNKNINIYNAAINGWDRQFNGKYTWGYMGGFSYTTDDNKTSFTSIFIEGPNQFPTFLSTARNPIYPTGVVIPPAQFQGKPNPGYNSNDRFLITNVLTHKWSDKLTQVLENDIAWETNVPFAADLGRSGDFNRQNAQWYGFGNWFLYSFNEKLTGVWRSEIFRDNNGVRTGFSANYSEFTLGLIYKPKSYIWVRPEARYDFANGARPYNDGTRTSQLTLGLDVILLF